MENENGTEYSVEETIFYNSWYEDLQNWFYGLFFAPIFLSSLVLDSIIKVRKFKDLPPVALMSVLCLLIYFSWVFLAPIWWACWKLLGGKNCVGSSSFQTMLDREHEMDRVSMQETNS